MTTISAQKRMSAEILKCGVNRIFIDPQFGDDVEMAITREDVRNLIKQGIIKKRPENGTSRSRANLRHERKKRGLSRGTGKVKGTKSARTPTKRKWINTIRPLRAALKKHREGETIEKSTYRKIYLRAKGGSFKSVATMNRFLSENKLLKK
jgi:large subunit ribosomal protein L19e